MRRFIRRKPQDTDIVDGGVRHYVDENLPKKIQSAEITCFSCIVSNRLPLCDERDEINLLLILLLKVLLITL